MDYKEKYKEALERCKKEFNFNNLAYSHEEIKQRLERVFPELKESEDERIRKSLIEHIKGITSWNYFLGISKEQMLAWLEKQVKKKVDKCEGCNNVKGCITCTDGDQYAHITEQKPADKVEPKSDLEKGKWYVCNTPRYRDFVVGKAYYCPKNGMLKPNENEMARYVARNCFHLWTIQDAKEGDVLCYRDHIFLMKYYVLFNKVISHCTYDARFILHNTIHLQKDDFSKIHPATKEQCDLLFHKIKELEYEWDAEKKELKKIENKPTWSEEDERLLKLSLENLAELKNRFGEKYGRVGECICWLKSIKERMKGE